MRILGLVLLLMFAVVYAGQAQSKKKKARKTEDNTSQPNSYSPYTPDESIKMPIATKKTKKKSRKNKSSINHTFDQKIEEFEKRMVANAKKYKKAEKEMQKPQYADPMYFGHKRKPKKRPPGKRKFCNECGIVH